MYKRQYEESYGKLIRKGLRKNPWVRGSPHKRGRVKQSKVRNLLERLRDHCVSVLAFMYDFNIPFTNNLAERDLRKTKVKLKISGCFRNDTAHLSFQHVLSWNLCRTRSYLSTTRKNGIAAFDAISDTFNGQPFIFKTNYARMLKKRNIF